MGIFKFVKSAGQKYVDLQKRNLEFIKDVSGMDGKIGIGAKDEAPEAVKPVKAAEPTPEEKAAIIEAEAKSLGLGGDYRVLVEGETVKLKGRVPDTETLEKIVLAAGNVEGIGEVDTTDLGEDEPGEASVFHTVKKGDTLSKIAKVYLGNAMKYPAIFEANKPMLDHPDRIYPGQVLRIPGGKAPEPKV